MDIGRRLGHPGHAAKQHTCLVMRDGQSQDAVGGIVYKLLLYVGHAVSFSVGLIANRCRRSSSSRGGWKVKPPKT